MKGERRGRSRPGCWGDGMPVLFRPIKPQYYDIEAFRREVTRELRSIAENIRGDYEATTAGWRTSVTFVVREAAAVRGGASIIIGTDSDVYRYVDEGTRPHSIKPKRAKILRFQTGYRPKTRPRVLRSASGGATGPAVFAKQVQHPGTRARGFTETIADKWQPRMARRVQLAIVRAAVRRLLRL